MRQEIPEVHHYCLFALEVQPPSFVGWFPNHHCVSRGLSSSKGTTILLMVVDFQGLCKSYLILRTVNSSKKKYMHRDTFCVSTSHNPLLKILENMDYLNTKVVILVFQVFCCSLVGIQ